MAPLTDPTRLAAYLDALGNWRFEGYVKFILTRQSYDWIKLELNIPERDIARDMHAFVVSGGKIDEVRETRPEWSGKHEFHYDLRLTINGKAVYIETRLIYKTPVVPDDSFISVVSIHAV